VLRLHRNPVGVQTDHEIDRLNERGLRQLGQGKPSSRSLESPRVGVRAEDGDPPVLLAVGLEAFENGLGIVEDGGSGVDGNRPVSANLRAVPALASIPPGDGHVLAEHFPEAWVGEDASPFRRGHTVGRRLDLESDAQGGRAHSSILRQTKGAEPNGSAPREEGRGI